MGEVYRAYDERLERSVALKLIRADRLESADARARFRYEARIAASLSHPAIVPIHDVLQWEDIECIVMELVEGKTLFALLRDGPLDLGRAIDLMREITDGLAEAHGRGIVHRDLNAKNVMVTRRGHARILDFGLAKQLLRGPGESSISAEGDLIGTFHAMSPEQAHGRPVDSRSDLFSLGALAFEMLTGQAPFHGATAAESLTRVCLHQPQPLRELNPQIPEALSSLVDHLLQKDPADRPQTADEVSAALSRVVASLAGGATTPAREVLQPSASSMAAPEPGDAGSSAVLKTLLVSDLVGSTKLVERLGDEGAAALSRLHDRAARDLMALFGGREIDKTDGFLLLFERPLNAALYAQAYHETLEKLTRDQGVELSSRVGIHLGEVILRENLPGDVARGAKPLEVEGLAKPMVARLMSLAAGRQTLLTRGTFDVARRSAVGAGPEAAKLRWEAHGAYLFKGVAEPVDVFEVGIEGRAPLSPPPDSEKVKRVKGPTASDIASTREFRKLVVPPRPRPRKGQRIRVGVAIGVLATAAIGYLVLRLTQRPPAAESSPVVEVTPRPSLAVLGFQNVSGRDGDAWIATAAAEMLTTELGIGGELRTIGGHEVARGQRELALSDFGSLAEEDLRRLRRNLGVDLVVYGSYSLLGPETSSLLRFDVRLRDAASGQVLAAEGATGTEQQLFDIVLRAGAGLRQKLGARELSPAQALAVQAALPTNSLAARLYAEGLAQLRRLDALSARDLLAKAVEADPGHPLLHAELAAAWSAMGYDARAEEAAQEAAELAVKLSANDRRRIEARYFEITQEWERSIEIYSSLLESFPDDVHLGLRLAEAQNSGGQARQALVTLEALRRLPSPASADPRLGLVESVSHYDLGDFPKALAAARQAAEQGRESRSDLLLARARMGESRALQAMGDHGQALAALEEAQDLFEAGGDRRGWAQALDLMALTVYARSDLEGARRLFERTLAVYREIGARADAARVLNTLGTILIDQGQLTEADALHREALDIFLELDDKVSAAATLSELGFRFHVRGELEAALAKYEEALALVSEIGHRSFVAIAITNIAEVQFLLGKLGEARRMHEESLAINREVNDKSGVAYDTFRLAKVAAAMGDLFVARSRFEEALESQNRLGELGAAAQTRLGLARLELLEGNAAEAEQLVRQSEQVLRTEGATDQVTLAQALLARTLLAQDKLAEAREAAAHARTAAESSEDLRVRLTTAIAAARVDAAGLVAADVAAALESLETGAAEAAAAGYVEYALEARLAAAEIEAATGRTAAAAARLEALEKDARKKGFRQIAKRAMAAGR